jgi:hypothetical protein
MTKKSPLLDVLEHDRADPVYTKVFRPMLVLQLGLYVAATLRLVAEPAYAALDGAADPLLRENHLGNIAIMQSQPRAWLLAIHMSMAVFWVAGVLTQKHLVRRMPDRQARRLHALLGVAMILFAVAGCLAGPMMAWHSHGHPAMRAFLLSLPVFFLPAIAMVWITARRRAWHEHRFWATTAFVGPALASLWAEALIYVLGRHTLLGPWKGELVGTAAAFVLAAVFVVRPAWASRSA